MSTSRTVPELREFTAKVHRDKGVTMPALIDPAFAKRYGLSPAGDHKLLLGPDGRLIEVGDALSLGNGVAEATLRAFVERYRARGAASL